MFDDINKKKINENKTEARQQARDIVNEAEKDREKSTKVSKSNWTFYQDLVGKQHCILTLEVFQILKLNILLEQLLT